MNIFIQELKAYRKSTIVWIISLSAIIILFLSLFPSFSKDAADLNKLLASYPEAVRKVFSLNADTFTSILGFYSFTFMYILLCGGIQAMNLGLSILSKEAREKTADFLMTKPVTRITIITAKLLAVLCSLIITNIAFLAVATAMAFAVKTTDFNIKSFLLISLSAFLVQLIFAALGVIISLFVKKIKAVAPLSLGIVFGFFIISMISSAAKDNAVRYLTPFRYFDTTYIIKNSSYELPYVVIGILIIIISITLSYYIYNKKDIHAV